MAHVDSYFCSNKVDPTMQLDILRGDMPPNLARSVRELITSPSEDLTYSSLKSKILKRNTQSEVSRFRSLLASEYLGGRTTTEFLHRLRELYEVSLWHSPLLKKRFFRIFRCMCKQFWCLAWKLAKWINFQRWLTRLSSFQLSHQGVLPIP